MQSRRIAMALATLAVVIAFGLLSGPAAFGPDGPAAEATLLGEVKKLLASDAEANDRFGWSVAVSGDLAVVGARLEDAGGGAAGAAYIFERDRGGANNWGQVKKVTASDAAADDRFGQSVAISGDTALVGAERADAEFNDAGAAYVFGRDQGGADNWGEVKKLSASGGEVDDEFGWSVAVNGDTAVVGARLDDTEGNDAGAAYVFGRDQGGANSWGQVTKLTASDPEANDGFGQSVAVSGDAALVGAYREDPGAKNAGAAYVFGRNQGGADTWAQVKKLIAPDSEADDHFGWSVAVHGGTAVVGARFEDSGGNDAGAAYIFERNQGGANNWGDVKKLTASDAEADDRFGTSVALSGDTAFVGACCEDAGGGEAGAAYSFGRDQGGADNWSQVNKLTASDPGPTDEFGWSVAVSGDTAVVGAFQEDEGADGAGAAYVFQEPVLSVGGIAELPEAAGKPLEAEGSSGLNATVVAVLAGVAAGALALGSAAWWARRRWAR